MAKTPQTEGTERPGKGRKLVPLVALVGLTLLAGGAGAGLGLHLVSSVEKTVEEKAKLKPEPTAPPLQYEGKFVLQPLEPIITNLAAPAETWIRLETSIVFNPESVPEPKVITAEIQQDVLAYIRTLSVGQLQGPSALQHLRDDLNERVAIRSEGRVSELIVETMVIQ